MVHAEQRPRFQVQPGAAMQERQSENRQVAAGRMVLVGNRVVVGNTVNNTS